MIRRVYILKSGFYTSIQDRGRLGYEHLGVPESGAMDMEAYFLANKLLNNPLTNAVLETTLVGPQIKFLQETYFVITGAQTESHLNKVRIPNNIPIHAKKDQILNVGKLTSGIRSYIAFDGGIETTKVLGSRSSYKGITEQANVSQHSEIPLGNSLYGNTKSAHIALKTNIFQKISKLRAYKGPEYRLLSGLQQSTLENQPFTISSLWDRMALQLVETIPNELLQISTSPVIPGTVQLTPSGRLMVLMRDCQTTGGYPRILQLDQNSLNQVAQRSQGNQVLFTVT